MIRATLYRWMKAATAALALAGMVPAGAGAVEARPVPLAADNWMPNEDDSWLFDVRSGQYRLGDGVRGYQTPQGICVDLGDVVLALDLAVRVDRKLRRATGWVFDERRSLTIDRDAGEVRAGSQGFRLGATTIRDTAAGWCVDLDSLNQWLGVPLAADLSNAVLRIDSKDKLPFQLAAERRARAASIRPQAQFDLASLPQTARRYQAWATPSVDIVASAGAVSDKRGGSYVQGRYEIFAAGEVLAQSFDARLSSDNEGVPDSLRMRLYRTDPQGQLLGPLRATYYGVGDVGLLSTGLVAASAPGRGAVLTNRPVERPDAFDKTNFRGDLPAGWDAELYRNGQLLAFTSPNGDGRYEFIDVPLQYGANRFEIVLYGPQGQIRREIRQVQVGMDSIPPQQTWYWAGVAQENADLIEFGDRRRGAFRRGWRGTAGIERGLDTRTSAAAYLHSLLIENVRHNYGEVALRRSIGPTLLEVGGSYADNGGVAARASWLAAFGETYVRGDAMRGWGGFVSDRLSDTINGIMSVSVDQSVKLGRAILPLHFDVRHVERWSGVDSIEASARASASFRALTFTSQLDWSRTSAPVGPDPPDNLMATLLANARIGGVRVRGEARFALSGDNSDTRMTLIGEWAGAGKRAGDTEWRAELGYDRGLDRARAGIGYTRRFNKLQLTGFGEVASDGSVAASLALAFSFGPKAGGGWRLSSEKLASRGQVIADVWMDENGDGVRQPGEVALPGVPLTAGNAFVDAATDKTGRGTIDGLEPFRAVLIGIDAGSLPDPYVQPALPGVVVSPRPGVATRVALPMVAAGEIEGTLRRDGGNPVEGLGVELVDAEGRVRATTLTEFDGYFLFEGVAYGRYTVRPGKVSAAALRLDGTFAISAVPGKATPRVRLGTLVLKPLRRDMALRQDIADGGNSARGPPGGAEGKEGPSGD
ncbi:MAG: carboxypeptidase regulatory-like domain-containing protein [Sphingopyxis sp.]|uniref:carboxypeptidase regulatory-like domain-containing protein n=1 Tax=Sphingopyxis sp. TaxID=1908224 RepID=UPI001A2D8BA4|nr:carboxypeptidase regulatory-like domain-containing protein [Sphingopyxis sp.]MBJ7502065.1 carboxypeptidase regulatory-like domain-containing protein [Sphingopyxis sp.]